MNFKYGLLLLASGLLADAAYSWPADLTDECSDPDPAWIWCDDFELDRSSDYFEGSADRQEAVGVNGSVASAFHFTQLAQSGGGIKIAFGRTPSGYLRSVDDGTNDYREIYWRMFVYIPDDWVGNGADKLSRATILTSENWSQAMIAHVWSGQDPGDFSHLLYIDPASGTDTSGNVVTTRYNDFSNLRWLGARGGSFPVFSSANFGQWHCIEARARLNEPNLSNGLFQLYVNNSLDAERTNLNWIGSYDTYGINAVFFENYWNNGSPVNQARYFDNLVISTERIGCGNEVVRPMPPEIDP